ncbi:LOW QUALITY PROTEIN: mediator of RNA polymerase II transcription subunit 29-like [Corapipo altera]|uniref:LOW QUALITY PROTEIN: mediator of RNA polymerase II transcription subunit 29-like n=1 Tax=Corapipo altera TaxID=415028 RepID=UPI000FD6697E|nr:LOW QUALITY PROTEIN: mediator of RNA polymerase II transcription subunit 29-like [Corapipo altera]
MVGAIFAPPLPARSQRRHCPPRRAPEVERPRGRQWRRRRLSLGPALGLPPHLPRGRPERERDPQRRQERGRDPPPTVGAAPGPALPAQAAQAQQDFEPVQRFRVLLPQLKESLQSLMKVAAQNLMQNCSIDSGQKSADGALQRFDKSLEEFYALCDQLELCLRLAHECLSQSFDSAKHAPALVPAAPKGEGGGGPGEPPLPYTQYLPLIKAQIGGAKDIHNALLEGANKITGKLPPPGGP